MKSYKAKLLTTTVLPIAAVVAGIHVLDVGHDVHVAAGEIIVVDGGFANAT